MADDTRQPLSDLTGAEAAAEAFDFFELLRVLERDGRLFGHGSLPDMEPARLGQHMRLGFATADLADVEEGKEGGPTRVTVANIGLLGPEGPMPLHLTRWVLDRLSQRWFAGAGARQTSDTTFVDFVNVLQHRMIALFYRAWADAQPAVQVERRSDDRVRSMLRSMAGIGLPGTAGPETQELDGVKLSQAAALARQVDGAERLTLFLSEAFAVPVKLEEFVGVWLPVPARLQSRLGRAHAAIGKTATIGPRTFNRQSRIELRHRAAFAGALSGVPARQRHARTVQARGAPPDRSFAGRRPARRAGGAGGAGGAHRRIAARPDDVARAARGTRRRART